MTAIDKPDPVIDKLVSRIESLEKCLRKLDDARSRSPSAFMQQIQAQRELDADVPTTWHQIVKDAGHARVLGEQLLANERSFRIAIARWYKQLGEAICAALRASRGYFWMQTISSAVTDEHRKELRQIVADHIWTGALISASIEFEMHQRRPNTRSVITYVQKGILDFVKRLPQAVISGVKLAVAGIMAVFVPDRIIEPIIEKCGKVVHERLTKEPMEQPEPAIIAQAVKDGVFSRANVEGVAVGVAVTHSTQGANLGTGAAGHVLAAANLVNAQKWMTLHGTGQIDSRVRKTHRRVNGQTVKVGELFTLEKQDGGTETCLYPGDPVLSVGNSRYCRCLRIYVWIDQLAAA